MHMDLQQRIVLLRDLPLKKDVNVVMDIEGDRQVSLEAAANLHSAASIVVSRTNMMSYSE